MRMAIISDIHGNATAFQAVLDHLDQQAIDSVFCLGDNIGYGPEPETVVNLLRKREIPSVVGNHELAVNDPDFLGWFNPVARLSLEKTMGFLSQSTLDYIAELPAFRAEAGCRFVHGFPPNSPTLYLFEVSEEEIIHAMEQMTESICFIGHTHELILVEYDGAGIAKTMLSRQRIVLNPEVKYIVNVGSVGQPRDGSNDAKYVILDTDTNELEVEFVSYNVSDTINKIYNAGLPEQHAWRLM
ncbi:MAG: metallophosphoesterase family protein [Thermodesulfobacteriota bacterium]